MSKNELIQLLKIFGDKTEYFASLENWMIPVISQNSKIEWELKTERLILAEKVKVKTELQNNSSIENGKTINTEFKIR